MSNKRTFLRKHATTIIYACVLSVLIFGATYNAYYVFDSFLHDNISTSVDIKNNDPRLPFLENLTVIMTFVKTVVPELWSLPADVLGEKKENVSKRMQNVRKFVNASFYTNDTGQELSIDGKFDLAYLMFDVTAADEDAVIYGRMQNFSHYHHANGPHLIEFFKYPFAEHVVEQFQADLLAQNYGQWISDDFQPPSVFIENTDSRTFSYTIPVAKHLNGSLKPAWYTIADWSWVDSSLQPPDVLQQPVSLNMFFSNSMFANEVFQWTTVKGNDTLEIEIRIVNSGIYDNYHVKANRPCQDCAGYRNVGECKVQCQVDLVVSRCKCVPFTYRRLVGTFQRQHMPFCTTIIYDKCVDENALESHCTREKCVPCQIVSNNYFMTVKHVSRNEEGANSKFVVTVICDNPNYVLFTTKYQNTWMEMLGQLGGNLGLFLSFSLLGVWQFSMYLFEVYTKRLKKSGKSVGADSQIQLSTAFGSWWLGAIQQPQNNTAVSENGNRVKSDDAVDFVSKEDLDKNNEEMRAYINELFRTSGKLLDPKTPPDDTHSLQ